MRLRWIALAATAAALLAGCGYSSGVPNAPSIQGTNPASAASADLLYVSNGSKKGEVDIFTFPQGKRVGKISNIGYPYGMCSDSHGTVWIAAYSGNHLWALYEFPHGSTQPIASRRSRREWDSCAIDPTTDNIAVMDAGGPSGGLVEVFRQSLKGPAKFFNLSFNPFAAAYDDRGNLYVDGGVGSEDEFTFEQLPKGAEKFNRIKLDGPAFWAAGNVAWDGKYITVGVATRSSGGSVIYRVQVSGKRGKIVDTIKPNDLSEFPRYAIHGGHVAATIEGYYLRRIGFYNYPAGGKRTSELRGFDNIIFMAYSP